MSGVRGWSIPSLVILCALLLVILLGVPPATSLYCTNCQHFDPGCRHGYYGSNLCQEPATHCYTLQFFLAPRGYGTFRGCISTSSNNSDSGCRRMTINGYTGIGCYEFCDWNGCNSAIRDPRPWEEDS